MSYFHTIEFYTQLDITYLQQLRRLVAVCQKFDGYAVNIYWDTLYQRVTSLPLDWVVMSGDKIIAYLGLFIFENQPVQISLLVDPNYRRQGIAKKLIVSCKQFLQTYNIDNYVLLLPAAAKNLIKDLERRGWKCEQTFYELACQQLPRAIIHKKIILQQACLGDINILAEIHSIGFHRNVNRLHDIYKVLLEKGVCWLGLAESGQVFGIAYSQSDEQKSWINNFTILPDYRGKGYSQALLIALLQKLRPTKKQPIYIKVNSANSAALKLYHSCNFEIVSCYRYYSGSF